MRPTDVATASRSSGEQRFHTLDGLRGVAALVVVAIHIPAITGHTLIEGVPTPPHGMLAVDFFFVLSGFVIANAYEQRLKRGLGLGAFLRYRIIRLWPLYLLALGVAVLQFAATRALQANVWTPATLGLMAAATAFMIPLPIFGFHGPVYPLNPVIWSLAAELIVNTIYAAIARHLTDRRLVVAWVFFGMLLFLAFWLNPHGSMGLLWQHFHFGLARAAYGFCAGVLAYRIHLRSKGGSGWSGWIFFVMLAALLLVPGEAGWRVWYEPLCTLLVFPVMVFFAARSTLGRIGRNVCLTAGTVSYALYVLHTPLARSFELASKALHLNTSSSGAGLALLGACVAISWIADVVYDRPVRRALSRAFPGPSRKAPPPAPKPVPA